MGNPDSVLAGAVVLIVDDNVDAAQSAARVLESMGCRAFVVDSSREALQRIDEGATADLVFSDVVMPDIDGVAFARLLRQKVPHLPVVLTTGNDLAARSLADAGVMALIKPYSPERLKQVLIEQLESARHVDG